MTTVGALNPLRYRGYIYDTETGLFYVSSRYYNPEVGRWINADDTSNLGADGTLTGYNLYAYCANNPVNKIDKNGEVGVAIAIFVGGSAIFGGIAGAFTAYCTGGNILEGALEGAALGVTAAAATIVAPKALAIAGIAVTATTTAVATVSIAGTVGMAVDYAAQRISHSQSAEREEKFKVDTGRMVKSGFTTAIASLVPTFGKPGNSVLEAVGSLIYGSQASFINSFLEVFVTSVKGSSKK